MWLLYFIIPLIICLFLRKRLRLVYLVFAILFSIFLVFMLLLNFRRLLLSQQLHIFTPLIIALEEYKSKYAYYPTSLEYLVPNYLDQIPAATGIQGIFVLQYAVSWNGEEESFHGKPFISERRPPYLLGLWGGSTLTSDIVIRYCPIQYDCRHRATVSVKKNGKWQQEQKIFEAKRIDNTWVQLVDY